MHTFQRGREQGKAPDGALQLVEFSSLLVLPRQSSILKPAKTRTNTTDWKINYFQAILKKKTRRSWHTAGAAITGACDTTGEEYIEDAKIGAWGA